MGTRPSAGSEGSQPGSGQAPRTEAKSETKDGEPPSGASTSKSPETRAPEKPGISGAAQPQSAAGDVPQKSVEAPASASTPAPDASKGGADPSGAQPAPATTETAASVQAAAPAVEAGQGAVAASEQNPPAAAVKPAVSASPAASDQPPAKATETDSGKEKPVEPRPPWSTPDVSPPPRPEAEHMRAHPEPTGRALYLLSLSALGVVYGDIGTSPLYALRECFHGPHAMPPTSANILGVLSLIFWSLVGVITIKYLVFVMRADNRGEGGILSLMALVLQSIGGNGKTLRKRAALVAIGLFGGALLYGDGVITPAISVLSAVEGLNIATDVFEPYVLHITVVILIALFMVQSKGTGAVGAIFGPFTMLWFVTIGLLGIAQIVQNPSVLAAVNPLNAVHFFATNGFAAFFILGSVFLVVTGGEALYADMGHFGKRPIRLAWYAVVLPALLLNYFGQGALLMGDASAAENPFYLLAPSFLRYPLVALATGAACIAAQAVISGAYSLTRQAVQLGYCPRINIVHTSEREIGQIYVPGLNWAMFAVTLALVLGFRTSSNLAAAYGIAVSTAMVTTTVLAYFVAKHRWKWPLVAVLPFIGIFLLIDGAFFTANILKLPDGGWFPLVLAAIVFTLMTTWKRGREILAERLRGATFPLEIFLKGFESRPPQRVTGTAVFMTGNPEGVPTALLHNLKHNKVLHERVVLLTIMTAEVPHIPGRERLTVKQLDHGMWQIIAEYGYMETPNVPEILGRSKELGLEFKIMETTFFLGRETLIPTKRPGMAIWREALFAWMSRNARSATSYFRIPPNRVVELGSQVEL